MNRRNVLGAAIGGVLACVGLGKRAGAKPTASVQDSGWHEIARFHANNERFYRGLLEETAKHCGPEVFVADDGSVMQEPLLLKVPELVGKMVPVPTEPILVDYMVASSTSEYNDLVPITVLYKDGRWQAETGPVKRVFHKDRDHANP